MAVAREGRQVFIARYVGNGGQLWQSRRPKQALRMASRARHTHMQAAGRCDGLSRQEQWTKEGKEGRVGSAREVGSRASGRVCMGRQAISGRKC